MGKNTEFITVTELSKLIGCSVSTIGAYYKFKKDNPDSELAKMLPDFVRIGNRNTRYWKKEDVEVIKEFRKKYLNGKQGAVAQSQPENAPLSKERTVTLSQYRKARNEELKTIKEFLQHVPQGPFDEPTKRALLRFVKTATHNIRCRLFGDFEEESIELRDDGHENMVIFEDENGNICFLRDDDYFGENDEAS
ncbi:MAG: hypothetical protein IKX68_08200 [Clostridiales bacterium]|nr:hypothetical protein [Clostridiales bacterium]